MMKLVNYTKILVWIPFVLVGCQAGQEPLQNSEQPQSKKEIHMTNQVDMEGMKSSAYSTRDQVKAAIRDIAGRLNVSLYDIKTVRVENVTWRNGSLGCPQKGTAYTQALVPGTLIVLRVDGAEYAYHASSDGVPQYCASPEPPHGAGT